MIKTKKFSRNMSGIQKTIIFMIIIIPSIILLSYIIGGIIPAALISIFYIFFLWISKSIWLPGDHGKTLIRKLSLWLVGSIAVTNSAFQYILSDTLIQYLKDNFSMFKKLQPPNFQPSIIILIFVLIALFIINYYNDKDTVLSPKPVPIEKDFSEMKFKERFEGFCRKLSENIISIDNQNYWSSEGFVQLDAEVEVKSGNKKIRRITNLLNAIKQDKKSKVFLVLGDPGSGKSVALRKLSMDLLSEANETFIVPIYINLKEWNIKQINPDMNLNDELNLFVIENLKSRLGDHFSHSFIDEFYNRMLECGRLFLIFDSFDEIPAVIDEADNSDLINKLSEVIYDYLAGLHNSRGVLSSRLFKRPADKPQVRSILEIRPFTDDKIAECIKLSIHCDESVIENLFKNKQALASSARNPFICALLANYIYKNFGDLPDNHADMYSSYIKSRLEDCEKLTRKMNLAYDRIVECCIDISYLMYSNLNYGLEIPVDDLKVFLTQYPEIEAILTVLEIAKIGRIGFSDCKKFSFIHRRFNEYFLVKKLIKSPDKTDLESIASDIGMRDALILFCEVAETNKAIEIADFCWSEISKIDDFKLDRKNPQYFRAIHCLRFLKDAFRSRQSCISHLKDDLTKFINEQIGKAKDLLSMKLAVESVGLLETSSTDTVVINALKVQNPWISETALRACRHLPKISFELGLLFKKYINSMGIFKLLKRKKELKFSFKLSEGFKKVYKYINVELIDLALFFISTALLFIITGVLIMILVYSIPILFLIVYNRVMAFSYGENSSLRSTQLGVARIFIFMCLITMVLSPEVHNNYYSILDFVFKINSFSSNGQLILFFINLILILFLLPWHQSIYNITSLIFHIKDLLKKPKMGVWFLVYICTCSFGFWGFNYIAKNMSKELQKQISIPLMVALAVLFIALMGYSMVSYLVKATHDKKVLKKVRPALNTLKVKRETIYNHFIQFRTNRYRLKYVNLLQDKDKREIEGDWPDGNIPNAKNDEASTRLAQLEERWIGLYI